MAERNEDLLLWTENELCSFIGDQAGCNDLASYILSIETRADLDDFLAGIFIGDNSAQQQFTNALLSRWSPSSDVHIPSNAKVYNKKMESASSTHSSVSDRNKRTSSQSKTGQQVTRPATANAEKPPTSLSRIQTSQSKQKPKKSSFSPLFSADGKDNTVINIPGRHPCDCQASKHSLINNCLSCGRIVCQQEGSGPCMFCGELVATPAELERIGTGSRAGRKLKENLMKTPDNPLDEAMKKAIAHRDKLLGYSQSSARRTKVIDDQSDYFSTDHAWLSDKERQVLEKKKSELHSQKHASRLEQKITFDFAGRQVITEEFRPDYENEYEKTEQYMKQSLSGTTLREIQNQLTTGIANPHINREQLQFISEDGKVRKNEKISDQMTSLGKINQKQTSGVISTGEKLKSLRLQDSELKQVVDNGMCMSMHQPWASLLVRGIKQHEGRSWYSAHRGRLWIASTVQPCSEEETVHLEKFYIQLYKLTPGKSELDFPHVYPTACLLGYVDVIDVLPQEDYRVKFPDGESNSPYVFICDKFNELPVKLQMKGHHKIYKLDPLIHRAARSAISTQ